MKTPDLKVNLQKLSNTRFGSKTPKFFRIIRTVGLIATGVGVAIATAPVSLPAAIVSAGPMLAWIGGTAATVSQFAKQVDN